MIHYEPMCQNYQENDMLSRKTIVRLISIVTLICTFMLVRAQYKGLASDSPVFDPQTNNTIIYLPLVVDETLPPIIPETTKLLTEESNQYLEVISADGLFTFSQSTPE